MGESAQKNLHQSYGFYLPNTPCLNKLIQEKSQNSFLFNDVISSQSWTFDSMAQILTFINQDNVKEKWYNSFNLVDTMKLAGYYCMAFSNQERHCDLQPSLSILNRSHEAYWTDNFSTFNNYIARFDGLILKLLDKKITKDTPKPCFYIIHLMGSHFAYNKRYPQNFSKFNADDITHMKEGRKTISEYVNSILYTDYILDEIIKRFSHKDTFLIYCADHGEELGELGRFGHYPKEPTKFSVEVPFFVYMSDQFILQHQTLYERIKTAINRPFMLDDMIHSIIDVATDNTFDLLDYENRRSLFTEDDSFLRTRIREVGLWANFNYDKNLKYTKNKF